jgi:precorrin-2 dehydrogenase / sirohydrochlorin ferrochelatase
VSSIISRSGTESSFYPLFLNLAGKLCVVIGGGAVAQRKVKMLLSFGAAIRLIAPRVTRSIKGLAAAGRIELIPRAYENDDLSGASLVFAATDDGTINGAVKEEAGRWGIPVNVADDPGLCDFYVPSIVRKGPIVVAISTSGTLPLLSKRLRRELEIWITKDYERYLRKVVQFRSALLQIEPDRKRRLAIMRELTKLSLTEVLKMTAGELKTRLMADR